MMRLYAKEMTNTVIAVARARKIAISVWLPSARYASSGP